MIKHSDFPERTQLQGMCSQADKWFLEQMGANEMTYVEALVIVTRLLQTVTQIIARQERDDGE